MRNSVSRQNWDQKSGDFLIPDIRSVVGLPGYGDRRTGFLSSLVNEKRSYPADVRHWDTCLSYSSCLIGIGLIEAFRFYCKETLNDQSFVVVA